ncbi:MAG: AAA family ATPase [Candidatus Coproplasma sp.]
MSCIFDSIAGYRAEKEELQRICEVIKNRKIYLEKGAKLPKGIIFYGEAGTGKTLFSKVLAEECGLYTYQINIANVNNSIQICRQIRRAFEKAAKRKEPSMIFFDELDKVLPNAQEEYYTDQSKTILAQLLTLIDGMDSSNNFIFVATCNSYGSLPETLVRPGRIDKKISIGKPDYESRVDILKLYAKKTLCKFEIEMEELSKLCAGFTCSALETLINECIIRSDENNFVSRQIITEKILEIEKEDIPRKAPSINDIITACRNVGYFVVAHSLHVGKYMLNLDEDNVCSNFFNRILSEYSSDIEYDDDDDSFYLDEDGCESKYAIDHDTNFFITDKEETAYYNKSDLLNTICVIFGGYASEKIIFNKVYDNQESMLSTIDCILLDMSSQGMFGIENVFNSWRNDKVPYSYEFFERLNALFSQTLSDCYKIAEDAIVRNKELIEKLIPVLVEKRYMDNLACEPVLKSLGGIKL